MPAYYIAEHIITDAMKFEEYRVKVAPMIASHGGRYLTKGGSPKARIGSQSASSSSNSRIWAISMPGTTQPNTSR
jgi:uncharacterized protein (DUF1330 family)